MQAKLDMAGNRRLPRRGERRVLVQLQRVEEGSPDMLGQVLEVGAQFRQMQVGAQFVEVPSQFLQRHLQGVLQGAL